MATATVCSPRFPCGDIVMATINEANGIRRPKAEIITASPVAPGLDTGPYVKRSKPWDYSQTVDCTHCVASTVPSTGANYGPSPEISTQSSGHVSSSPAPAELLQTTSACDGLLHSPTLGLSYPNSSDTFKGPYKTSHTVLSTASTAICPQRTEWSKPLLPLLLAWVILNVVSAAGMDGQEIPVRVTSEGPVRGYLHELDDGRGISERYLGIPYASPPVGTRRFRRPAPASKREGRLETTRLPPACMQIWHDASYILDYMPTYDGRMEEDCLYLNIYVPHSPQWHDSNRNRLLPVLVHIHGGSNVVGQGSMFHPDPLAVLGHVIIVTVNYRLGVLGFLSAPHIGIYGNMGLWDQQMALAWVQDNIIHFGGDKSKVTIQGHSAGAVDVGLHLLSPKSKGLFRYTVLQSGSPLAGWAVLPTVPPEETAMGPSQHLDAIGCPTTGHPSQIMACLQAADVHTIVDANYEHAPGYYAWSATVDGDFLPASPDSLVSSDPIKPVVNAETVLVGLVQDEGSLTAEAAAKNQIFEQKHGRLPSFQEVMRDQTHVTDPPAFTEDQFDIVRVAPYDKVAHIKELSAFTYLPWDDPDNTTRMAIAFSDYAGDITFVAPAVKLLDKLTSLGTATSFMYVFDHWSSTSEFPAWMGSIHGEDLAYVFGCPLDGQCGRNFTLSDLDLSLKVIEMWSNFVHTGIPSVSDVLPSPQQYDHRGAYICIETTSTNTVNSTKFSISNSSSISRTVSSPSFSTYYQFRARHMRFWNFLLPSLSNDSHTDINGGSRIYRVITLTLAIALVAVTFTLIAVSAILVDTIRKQRSGKVGQLEPVSASTSLV